jgi:hypothetical protein
MLSSKVASTNPLAYLMALVDHLLLVAPLDGSTEASKALDTADISRLSRSVV